MRCLVLLCMLAGLAEAAPRGAVALLDRPVATVDNVAIWQSQLDRRMSFANAPDPARTLDTMIDEELVLAEGRRAKVEATPEEVAQAIAEIEKANQLTDAQLDAALAEQHMTRADYTADIARQIVLLRTRLQLGEARAVVSDAEVDAEVARTGRDRGAVHDELLAKAKPIAVEAWLARLRERARIEKRLEVQR